MTNVMEFIPPLNKEFRKNKTLNSKFLEKHVWRAAHHNQDSTQDNTAVKEYDSSKV